MIRALPLVMTLEANFANRVTRYPQVSNNQVKRVSLALATTGGRLAS
jgi:hypothetical protein